MLKTVIHFIRNSFSSNSKFITKRDLYQSLEIHLQQKASPQQVRTQILFQQITQKNSKTNSIWVFLNQNNLEHAAILVNQFGYKIHHGKNQKITLYKWLSEKSDLVPPYSSFYLSCGAVVIHNDHILLVQQGNGPRKGLFGIPGGRADVGEFLETTAERQLFEETGIKAHFQHFIYLRHMENTIFGADDIYFVCLMKAEEQSLKKIKLCDRQLTSYEWVHLSKLRDFVNQKAFGTQMQVGNYIHDLYKKGYKFQTSNKEDFPNLSTSQIFRSTKDKILRKYIEYKLINPNHKSNFESI